MIKTVINLFIIAIIMNVTALMNVKWLTKCAKHYSLCHVVESASGNDNTNPQTKTVRDSFVADLKCYINGTRIYMPLPLNIKETELLRTVHTLNNEKLK